MRYLPLLSFRKVLAQIMQPGSDRSEQSSPSQSIVCLHRWEAANGEAVTYRGGPLRSSAGPHALSHWPHSIDVSSGNSP